MKPGSLLQLRTGKLLDTFSGFVDFFNWMARFLFRLRSRGSIQFQKDSDDTYYLDIKGFPEADSGTTPVKNSDGAIEWKTSQGTPPDEKSIWERDNKLEIYAFYDAPVDCVPVKDESGVIVWKPYAEAGEVETTFEGTDGSSAKGQYVKFVPDPDTNLTVHVDKNAAGIVTISIGLRWMNV